MSSMISLNNDDETEKKKRGNPIVSGIMAAANLLIHTIPRMKIEFKFTVNRSVAFGLT